MAATLLEPLAGRLRAAACIGLVRTSSPESAIQLGRALLDAGLGTLEVSFTTPGAAEVIAELTAEGRGIVGAGTVLEPAQAIAALEAGARFLVTPAQPAHLVGYAHEAGAIAILSGLTPTEIVTARQMGSDFVKVFPIRAMGGATYLRDILAPLPDVPLLVSGGVDHTNYRTYLEAGAALCVLGSQLFPKELIAAQDWQGISAHVRMALASA